MFPCFDSCFSARIPTPLNSSLVVFMYFRIGSLTCSPIIDGGFPLLYPWFFTLLLYFRVVSTPEVIKTCAKDGSIHAAGT